MYNEFNDMDSLMEAVRCDRTAEGVNAIVQNRYPIRFVLFDNFKDSYAFILRMIQDEHVAIKEIQDWMDPDYPDTIITHHRLVSEVDGFVKSSDGESCIIIPFSELSRFYDNKDYKEFDTLIRTIKAIETTREGWEKKQRVYIPIVGLEGKMSTFFGDTQATIWYMRNFDQELNYRLILADNTTYEIKNIESRYAVINSVDEWLSFWKHPDLHNKTNIICTSRAIYANAGYAQPDNAFGYCLCENVYEFLVKGLGLKIVDIEYKPSDDEFWIELASEIDLKNDFNFDEFFLRHFSIGQFKDYKSFVRLWFEYSDGFSRWLLINTYKNKNSETDYLSRVLTCLVDYSDREFVSEVALAITDNSSDMDIRYYCLDEAAKRGIQLTEDVQIELYKKLENIAEPDNHRNVIRFFTPISKKEKELAISWLSAGKIQTKHLLPFYPEMYYYLEPSTGTLDPNKTWVLDYIDHYKWAKVTDDYTDDIKTDIKKCNSSDVKFNTWYQQFKTTNSLMYNRGDIEVYYWIDGLGIDWIPLVTYLIGLQRKEQIFLNEVKIARAVLPTKTDINKDNLLKLISGGAKFERLGDIDKLAHRNDNLYPINIIDELDAVCNAINDMLKKYVGKKIAIVSDHGISYLSQKRSGLNLGGYDYHHYGRYAVKSKGNPTRDENYFLLEDGKTICALNHHSLGNKISVGSGAHGGCTPEEVLVPVFIISSSPNNKTWSARLLNKKVSAVDPVFHLKIVGLTSMESPKIVYNGKIYKLIGLGNDMYDSEPIELIEDILTFELEAGEYAEIINIETINTGSQMNDMFSDFGF
ncbi:MAG: BREX-4 system phosphatase PglZ [Bacteroides sp.]|nr:BREX-4 system phosphatase PglZ [Bacteroides sp.]